MISRESMRRQHIRKKPFYKKWWVWLIVVFCISLVWIFSLSNSTDNDYYHSSKSDSTLNTNNKILQSKSKTGSVGVMKITTTKIIQEKVTKNSDDNMDAEYNFNGFKEFPKHYYRTTINYTLTNTGSKKLGLGYSDIAFVDKQGQKYTRESNDSYGSNDWSGNDLQPKNTESAKFIILTKRPVDLTTYTVDTGAQYADGETQLNDGGVIKFK